MEAISRDRVIFVVAYEWTQSTLPLRMQSHTHSAWAAEELGSMVFSLLNLSVSHKWGIGPSSLHTSSPKIEQTASCRPWMWPPSGRETGPRLNHTRA